MPMQVTREIAFQGCLLALNTRSACRYTLNDKVHVEGILAVRWQVSELDLRLQPSAAEVAPSMGPTEAVQVRPQIYCTHRS